MSDEFGERTEFDLKVKELLTEETNQKRVGKVKCRRLGKTNLMVSEVGLGGHEWAIDGLPAKGTEANDKERTAIIEKAIELGVNFFDTCNFNEGESLERRLKQLDARDKCFIAYGDEPHIGTSNERHIREILEKQLKLLNTDKIDVFRVVDHHVKTYCLQDDIKAQDEIRKIAEIFEKLKKEGKIKFSCFATHEQDDFMPWAKEADIGKLFDVLQLRLNFLNRGPLDKIIPYAKEHDMGIVVVEPFRKGTLLNKYCGGQYPADLDLRKPSDPIFESLKDKDKGMDYALMKFVLSCRDISTVIPGVATVEQLVKNVAASILE